MVEWYIDFSSISSLERIIEGLISVYTAALMLYALKQIHKDRNRILNDLDKTAFVLATLNSLVLTVYFFLGITSVFLLTIRTLRLMQDIMIAIIFLIMLYREKTSTLRNTAFIACFLAFALWVCGLIFVDARLDYDCADYIWIVFSGITVILSSLNIYIGFSSYSQMKERLFTQKNLRLSETEKTATPRNQFQEQQQLTLEDLNNTKMSLFALMGSSFLSIFIQFIWDYLLHVKSVSEDSCLENYHSTEFGSFVLFTILKVASFLPSIWGIHYVFYHRNRNNFNTVKESEERSLSVFYDFRSEYMDDDTNDPEDFKEKRNDN